VQAILTPLRRKQEFRVRPTSFTCALVETLVPASETQARTLP
jgi:hypothetical protein